MDNNLDIFNYLLQQPNIEIGTKCFENCDELEQFSIPPQVALIGANAFNNCANLKEVIIPSSVTYIGDNSFNNCTNLKEIIIPSSVTYIGDNAFHDCKCFEEIIIPSSVTSLGNSIVSGCSSLRSIQIPQNIKKIGILDFQNLTFLTEFNIPKSVTSIGEKAFYRCISLTKIGIPSSVTHIAKYAFYQCSSLEEITLSSSTKSIDLLAFKGCSSLKNIKFDKLPSNIGSYLFPFCTSLMQKCRIPRFQINENTVIRGEDYFDIDFFTKESSNAQSHDKYSINVIVMGGSPAEEIAFITWILGENKKTPNRTKNFDIAGMSIPVNFYDPSESSLYQEITKIYFRMTHCAVIMFDLTNRKSFEKARYICDSIFDQVCQIPIILIGTRCELKSEISSEEIARFSIEYCCEYFEMTSQYIFDTEQFLCIFNECILYEAFQECYCRKVKKEDITQILNQEYRQKSSCF